MSHVIEGSLMIVFTSLTAPLLVLEYHWIFQFRYVEAPPLQSVALFGQAQSSLLEQPVPAKLGMKYPLTEDVAMVAPAFSHSPFLYVGF